MSLLEKIKADCLSARKARDGFTSSALITLIGEAERVGKDAGNRAPTDAEVVAVLMKFVKNLGEVLKVRPADTQALAERTMLETYLPTRLTGEALVEAVAAAAAAIGVTQVTGKDIGAIMKALVAAHAGAYDGAEASAAVRALIR